MSNEGWWWNESALPPPSMRQQFVANPLRRFSPSPNAQRRFPVKQTNRRTVASQSKQEDSADFRTRSRSEVGTVADLEKRLDRLRASSGEMVPSVSDIETRLAKLRDVPVEYIRNPRTCIVNRESSTEESVKKLLQKAKDEAAIARKWSGRKLDSESVVNPQQYLASSADKASHHDSEDPCSSDGAILMGQDTIRNLKDLRRTMKLAKQRSMKAAKSIRKGTDDQSLKNEMKELMELDSEDPCSSDGAILMGQDTIRNLKDLRRTMKLAKQRSMKAAKSIRKGTDDQSLKNEMKELMELARQSSVKSERINEEMSKFWKGELEETSSLQSDTNSESSDLTVSDEELQRVGFPFFMHFLQRCDYLLRYKT
ncbi:unnamed protein product [Gongylonema pulchrum]|uniref:Ribosome biogenesis protein SLX9 n=1 Tax=Gongylonema pulchrum TaxID=637853 RepID=A0A183E8P7_9BILA|nr:unnamed protein product [Gongylonema pulchrum]